MALNWKRPGKLVTMTECRRYFIVRPTKDKLHDRYSLFLNSPGFVGCRPAFIKKFKTQKEAKAAAQRHADSQTQATED
jgi:hypothetical protein